MKMTKNTLFTSNFPRMMGKPRDLVFNKEEYMKWIQRNHGNTEIFTSVNYFPGAKTIEKNNSNNKSIYLKLFKERHFKMLTILY